MELYQLVYFSTVSQYKSFSKAAKQLYITPSTLTISIKKLEAELGTELIIRSSKSFLLTPAGELLLEYTKKIRGDVAMFRSELQQLLNTDEAVKVGLALPLCSMRLLENLDLFSLEHSDIRLTVTRRTGRSICKLLSDNTITLGIVLSRHHETPNLNFIPFESVEYGVYLPAGHAWVSQGRVTPHMLESAAETLINYKGGIKYALDRYFSEYDVTLREGRLSSMYIENALRFVSRGMGLVIMPIDSRDSEHGVVCLPLDPPLVCEHFFVRNRNTPLLPGQQTLIDYLLANSSNKLGGGGDLL